MPVLQVGATAIPYTVTESQRARRLRIVVNNGVVEVIVPAGTAQQQIVGFLYRRRRWVFDTRAKMLEGPAMPEAPHRYVGGAKIAFRGRQVRLRVQHAPCSEVQVAYRGGFVATVPDTLDSRDRDVQVEAALNVWLRDRLWEDVAAILDRSCMRLGLEPRGFRLRDQKHLWGSCGRDGTIFLNLHLVRVPRPVLEYVVVHEVCHLRHRMHSREFWGLVASVLPDYEARRMWLERYGRARC